MFKKLKLKKILTKLTACLVFMAGMSALSVGGLKTFANEQTNTEVSPDELKDILKNFVECSTTNIKNSNESEKPVNLSAEFVWRNCVIKISVAKNSLNNKVNV